MFTSNRREKRGWDTDYPGADINFSIRLAELTKTRVSKDPGEHDPDHVVVRLTDQALFQCPFAIMEDAGTAFFNDQEVIQFREYLLKGGFVFVSDYWGPLAKEQFDEQIGRVLPHDRNILIINLPLDRSDLAHAVRAHAHAADVARSSRGGCTGGGANGTSGSSDPVDAHGIVLDDHGSPDGRDAVHNSDIPDGWEREGEEHEYFLKFSPDAYAVGIDVRPRHDALVGGPHKARVAS